MSKYLDGTGLERFTHNIKSSLSNKANINGSYESLTAGTAKNLESPDGVLSTATFTRRTTGGSTSVAFEGVARVESIQGNTIIWNQLVDTNTSTVTLSNSNYYYTRINGIESIVLGSNNTISVSSASKDMVCNLSLMFKGNSSQIPTTVIAFRTLFPEYYYAYSSGIFSFTKPTKLVSTGFNQYNGTYARVIGNIVYYISGSYNTVSFSESLTIPARAITVTDRLFTPPSNGYVYVTGADGTTCINISWSGIHDGEYEGYELHEAVIYPSIDYNTSGGFKRLNGVYDERNYNTLQDIIRLNKTTFNDLSWEYDSSNNYFYADTPVDMKVAIASNVANMVCIPYNTVSKNNLSSSDKAIANLEDTYQIFVKDSAYSTVANFLTNLGNTVLLYEKRTYTYYDLEESVAEYYQAFDWGTETWEYPGSIAAPVTSSIYYMQNLVDKLRTDVVTISEQDLTSTEQTRVRANIGAGNVGSENIGTPSGVVGIDATTLQGHNSAYFQDKLYNGQNIKSINGASILGQGNLIVGSGGGGGSNVAWTQVTQSGTKIAEISIDGNSTNVYAPEGGHGDVESVNGKTGVVVLDKTDIGLGNVDNTSDLNKPISTATQTALNAKYARPSTGIPKNDLADSVKSSLDLADSALQSHQDISGKVDKTGSTMTGALTMTAQSSVWNNDNIKDNSKGSTIGFNTTGQVGIEAKPDASVADSALTLRINNNDYYKFGNASFRPETTDATNLGTSSNEWNNIYGKTIYQNGKLVANSEDIPTVPTNVSAFTNDSGYITSSYHDDQKADVSDVEGIGSRVTAIEGKIPSDASTSNQLADKSFVNSSIATETAIFRGNFNVVTDLSLQYNATNAQISAAIPSKVATVTNNDYVFISMPKSNTETSIIIEYRRFKYSSSSSTWAYEFTLNNSSFTAEQWAAINSGISSSLIESYDDHLDDSSIHVTTGDKNTWNALVSCTDANVNNLGYTKNIGTITGITMNSTSMGTSGNVNLGTVLTSHQDISGKENTSNKITSWQNTPDNTHYPSEKLVKDSLDAKANTSHSQAASTITAGTLAGKVMANSSAVATVTDKQVRNIFISNIEPTSADGENGDIWIVYS